MAAIGEFRQMVVDAGRGPATVPIKMFVWGWAPGDPSREELKEYGELDTERPGAITSAPCEAQCEEELRPRHQPSF